jgi:predicted phosphodiesterase
MKKRGEYSNADKNKRPKKILLLMAVLIALSIIHKSESLHATNSEVLAYFNFAAVGDWGCTSNTKNTLNSIQSRSPELVLGLGDYSYDTSADCWFDIIEPIKNIMKIVLGNHEIKDSKLTDYMEYFGLNNQYYSFNFQNVHFLVMSDYAPNSSVESLQAYQKGSEQYNFVKNDLAIASTDPRIDWIIVSHHVEQYASTANYDIPAENEWIEIYHPLFEEYNTDLILQGHQHNYQRTYPIKYNIENPDEPIITAKSKNTYTNPEGQIFVTVGTGGINLQSLHGNQAPHLVTTEDEEFGFLDLNITNNRNDNKSITSLSGIFYGNDRTTIDQFRITK